LWQPAYAAANCALGSVGLIERKQTSQSHAQLDDIGLNVLQSLDGQH
jgi:hypothetical protein